MPDLLLLGLIGALTLLLLLTLLAFAGYSGLLTGVTVSAGSPPIRNITVAYKFHVGSYGDTGHLSQRAAASLPSSVPSLSTMTTPIRCLLRSAAVQSAAS